MHTFSGTFTLICPERLVNKICSICCDKENEQFTSFFDYTVQVYGLCCSPGNEQKQSLV